MAMGYSPVSETIIEVEELKKLGLETFVKFEETLNKSDLKLNDVMYNYYHELGSDFNEDHAYHSVVEKLESLFNEFEKKYDLELVVGYHDQEYHGSTYDDIDGGYFAIWGVYQLTPEAKKLKEIAHFEDKHWVHYG